MSRDTWLNGRILVRGGGDLASGVILRLHRCGFNVLVTDLAQPVVVRRTVAFAEAIYQDTVRIEEITGRQIVSLSDVKSCWGANEVPVSIDADGLVVDLFKPDVVVDARMMKNGAGSKLSVAPLVIGLGPGFSAGTNCHAVIETQRGPFLGRVFWSGEAAENTGIPEIVMGRGAERVLRSPANGVFQANHAIGDFVEEGVLLGVVDGHRVVNPFRGMIRGLIHSGLNVVTGMKLGDIDPRQDARLVKFVSDKALSIGGGVLEAILTGNDLSVNYTKS